MSSDLLQHEVLGKSRPGTPCRSASSLRLRGHQTMLVVPSEKGFQLGRVRHGDVGEPALNVVSGVLGVNHAKTVVLQVVGRLPVLNVLGSDDVCPGARWSLRACCCKRCLR